MIKKDHVTTHSCFSPNKYMYFWIKPLTLVTCTCMLKCDFFSYCRKPLVMCTEKQLIGEHLKEILDKGIHLVQVRANVVTMKLLLL